MAQSPPISPKIATPLAHRKRRHSTIDKNSVIDLTEEDDGDVQVGYLLLPEHEGRSKNAAVSADESIPTAIVARKLEDDDEIDEDDRELLEDILDTSELEPYKPGFIEGQDDGLDRHTASRLRSRLLRDGPEKFIHEILEINHMRPTLLGTAFGIDPDYAKQLGEAMFVRVLSAAIVRAYYKRRKLPQYNNIDDAAELLRTSDNIMVITGAGISTSLGIPDFRSKETGFYTKLRDIGFSEPEEVFDIYAFDEDPSTFYKLAADIIPDLKRCSPTHAFIRLLQDKNKLQTNYTQNIDNLEELAGIDKDRLIQCHGSFATATCRKCNHKVKGTDIYYDIRHKRVAYCKRCINRIAAQNTSGPKSKKHKPTSHHYDSDDEDEDDNIPQPGVMKPDITFFGEQLPDHFFTRFTDQDVKTVDLVLVIGTSLKVAPVSEMPNYLPHHIPHVYISREPVQHVEFDVQLLGNCDDVVVELARRAGWKLRHEMVEQGAEMQVVGVEDHGHWWAVKKRDHTVNGHNIGDGDVPGDVGASVSRDGSNGRA